MANSYRNGGSYRNSLPARPVAVTSNVKGAVKSKSFPASGLRKSSPASLSSAAKDDAGGSFTFRNWRS